MEIRSAENKDVAAIYGLIQELALYEKAPEQVTNTLENLHKDLFMEPICEAIVAEENQEIIGFALFYTSYSTWKGKSLYLEDFFVSEKHRRKGVGQLLFERVVQIAQVRNMARMDWQVLEWNKLAIDFYKKNNALLDPEWINGRIFFQS